MPTTGSLHRKCCTYSSLRLVDCIWSRSRKADSISDISKARTIDISRSENPCRRILASSISMASKASIVPFSLQDEVIIQALTGETRTSAAAEHEKNGGSFLREILNNRWLRA
uniref:Uncharacterized protein n=1 Tax=Opuntia streptacantha TaxID=393608 RepID=A0A7C9DEW4_OPUST